MATDERERHDLLAALIEHLGEQPAMTLIDYLPPFSWDEGLRDLNERMERRFAEHDRRFESLEQQLREVRQELAAIRQEFGGEIASLRQELSGEIGSLRQELAAIRQELGGEIGSVRQGMTSQTRLFFLGMIASNMTVASLAFAAARLA